MESYSAALESKVLEVYTDGVLKLIENLCCPTSYDSALLKGIPQEILDRDYGCGDPSRYVKEGDVVVDLGSGVGKMCYMVAKQISEPKNLSEVPAIIYLQSDDKSNIDRIKEELVANAEQYIEVE